MGRQYKNGEELNKANPIKAFFTVPWGKDRVRSNVVLVISFALIIVVWALMVAYLPDDADAWTTIAAIAIMLVALIIASALLKASSIIRLYRNISISRALKVQFYEAQAWILRLPFNTACALSSIDDAAQMRLIDGSPEIENNHPFIARFLPFCKKGNAKMLRSRQLVEAAPPVEIAAMLYSNGWAWRLIPPCTCYEYMEGLLADIAKRNDQFSVCVVEYLSSKNSSAVQTPPIYRVLHALGVVSDNDAMVLLSTGKLADEEIAEFLSLENTTLIYDETSFSRKNGFEPLLDQDQLVPIRDGKTHEPTRYLWHAPLPEEMVTEAIQHELADISIKATIIKEPPSRSFHINPTRIHPTRILELASLGMTTRNDLIASFSVKQSRKVDCGILDEGLLAYDDPSSTVLDEVQKFRGELDDVLAIWDKAQNDYGARVSFTCGEDTPDEEVRQSIAGIAELMGVEPMLEAYYAGVPLDDIIA